MKSKKSLGIITILIILHLNSINLGDFQVLNNRRNLSISSIRDSSPSAEGQIDLEFGIPTKVAEISYNFSENEDLRGIGIETSFDGENGTIWINAENGTRIWQQYLNDSFYDKIENVSKQAYSLWANSSTLGNHTLYFNFWFNMGGYIPLDPGGFFLFIGIIVLGIVIGVPVIIYNIIKIKKKGIEPKLPRIMERIIEKQREKDHSVQAIHKINKKFAIISVVAGIIIIGAAINPFFRIFPIKWLFIGIGFFLLIMSIYGFYLYIKKPEWVEKKYGEFLKRKYGKTNDKN